MEFLEWIPVFQTLGQVDPQACAIPTNNRKSGGLSSNDLPLVDTGSNSRARQDQTYNNQAPRGTGRCSVPTSRIATDRLANVMAASDRRLRSPEPLSARAEARARSHSGCPGTQATGVPRSVSRLGGKEFGARTRALAAGEPHRAANPPGPGTWPVAALRTFTCTPQPGAGILSQR